MILDGNFIFKALKHRIDIRNRIETLLQGSSIKLYVLQSIVKELQTVGQKAHDAIQFVTLFCETIDDSKLAGSNPNEKLVHLLGSLMWILDLFIRFNPLAKPQSIKAICVMNLPSQKPRGIVLLPKTRNFAHHCVAWLRSHLCI